MNQIIIISNRLTLDLNSSRKRRKSVAGGPEQLDRDLKREAGVVLNNELFSFHGTPEPTEMVFGRFHALLNTLVLKMLHKIQFVLLVCIVPDLLQRCYKDGCLTNWLTLHSNPEGNNTYSQKQ